MQQGAGAGAGAGQQGAAATTGGAQLDRQCLQHEQPLASATAVRAHPTSEERHIIGESPLLGARRWERAIAARIPDMPVSTLRNFLYRGQPRH